MGRSRLAPAEHTRALDEAVRWCARNGLDMVDDLVGGGVDLEADAALWEDFLAALKLPRAIMGNRIRRELMRRRAALAEPPSEATPAAPPPKQRWRRASARAGAACPIQ